MISIIVPIYNSERYIVTCLDSILAQTYADLEIILVNDGSTDGTVEICKKYAKKDSRIVLINNEANMGAGLSRNVGMDRANGEYFLFIDADDYMAPDLVEIVYQKAQEDELELTLFQHQDYYDDTDEYKEAGNAIMPWFLKKWNHKVFSWNDVKDNFYQCVFCVPWNRLYLAEFVRKSGIRFPKMHNSEDLFFGNSLVTLANRMGFAGEGRPLIFYRRNTETQLSANIRQAPFCMYESVLLLYEFLNKRNMLGQFSRSFHSLIVDMLSFPILSMQDKIEGYRFVKKTAFLKLNMLNLNDDDFTDCVHYERYVAICELRAPVWNRDFMYLWQKNRKKADKIINFLIENKDKKIALWGAARQGRFLIRQVEMVPFCFSYVFDSDEEVWGTDIGGIKVENIDNCRSDIDYVVVTNRNYASDIRCRIDQVNPDIKILDFHTFFLYDMEVEDCVM
uniref:glycosyltransferase family 2 protein n=1 Tax=Acetatifactor sp. TaxID=1872090 RepID=UPI0040572225